MSSRFTFKRPMSLMALAFVAACGQTSKPSVVPVRDTLSALQAANQSFVDGNFEGMSAHVKRALIESDNDERVVQSSVALLKKARSNSSNEIPVDWTLPDGVTYLKIAVRRTTYEGNLFRMQLNLDQRPGQKLVAAKVVRYPDETWIDLKEGIGEHTMENDVPQGTIDHWFGSTYKREAPRDGLYLIDIAFEGGETTKGWVILDHMTASETPKIFTPFAGDVIRTTQPLFVFENFRSPEYTRGQKRRLYIRIGQPQLDDVHEVFDRHVDESDLTSFAVGGSLSRQGGLNELAAGDYRMSLVFEERSRFGPVVMARQATALLPFTIRP